VPFVAPAYGGEVNTFPELDVTMPCTAKPALLLTLLAEDADAPAAEGDATTAAEPAA